MAKTFPDWVTSIMVAVTVENKPIPPSSTTETAAGGVGHYAGSSTDYVAVKSWTVTALKVGELKEISFTGTVLAKTVWQVVIGPKTFVTEMTIGAPLTLPFFDLKLAAETVVTVSVRSSDGTSINADASIVAKEIA